MPPRSGRVRWPRLLGLAFAAIVVACIQGFAPGLLSTIERAGGDLAWRLIASDERPERRIVIVDIDEASLTEVGPWPWPRATIEQLSRRLNAAGVAAQVFDVVFPESREGDPALAMVWSESPVTGGQILSVDPLVAPHTGEVAPAGSATGCPEFAPRGHGFIANAPALSRSLRSAGHMTPRVDADGVVRQAPALICLEGRAYPALAMASLSHLALSGDPAQAGAEWQWERSAALPFGASLLAPSGYLTSPRLPGLVVPVDANGNVRLPYRLKRSAFVSISAADVLAGRADRKLLGGAVALIGATAFGLADAISTPESAVASGVEVHAQWLVGLLDHRLPWTPASAAVLEWLGGAVVLALLLLLTQSKSNTAVKRLPLAGIALAAACFALFVVALARWDIWLNWAVPALLSVVAAMTLATVELGLTRAQRERLSAHLGAYLPAPVARMLMLSDPSGSIKLEQREVSVLVADIRNFSAYAANKSADETATLLHAFCCIAVDVVEANGGVVENVVGDCVIAIWNAYSDCHQHEEKSLQAARELLRSTRALFDPALPVREADLVQPLALGVGAESGLALVGSFGPMRRRGHAALGEPVSVATRLQQMTQELSLPILIGPRMAQALPSAATESVGEYLLEGLTRHYAIFAPVGWASLTADDLAWQPARAASHEAHEASDERLPAGPFGRSYSPLADR